jgi:hypothetical protein
MKSIQSWRASNTYTETQWAALLADATRRRAFSRGAFALVVADLDGGFVALYCKGQTGTGVSSFKLIATGVAEIPAPPADVLLDVAAPNTNVRLGVAGVGAAISDAALLALLVTAGAVDLTTAQALSNKKLAGDLVADGFTVSGLREPTDPSDAATKQYVDNAGGSTPDTITPTVTPGGPTSGETTLLLTITDSLGAPRVGAMVMLVHNGTASCIPTVTLGTLIVRLPNTNSFSGVLYANTDNNGQVRFRFNADGGSTCSPTASVFSPAPRTLAITPFVAP